MFRYIKYTIGFGIQCKEKQIYLDFDYFIVDHNIINYAGISKKDDIQAFTNANHASNLVNQNLFVDIYSQFLVELFVLVAQSTDQLLALQLKPNISCLV